MKATAKKVEQLTWATLQESEIRYRRLFEAAQDGILILDAKTGFIEDVNPYLIKLLGYSHAQLIKKKLWEVGAFKDIKASQLAFNTLQKKEYIRYENLPLKTKDGRLIQVEFISNVYRVGNKKVIQCDIRDITEHRRMLEACHENEKIYHDLVNQSPDGFFVVGISGKIISANKAMYKELGFSEAELLGMNIWDIIPKQYLAQHKKRLTKILEGKSLVEEAAEYAIRGKDGKLHYVEILSAPRYSGKDIIGFQGVAHDIDPRKQAEEDLVKSKTLLSEAQKMGKIGGWIFDVATLTQTWTEETFHILEIDMSKGEPKVPEGLNFITPAYKPMAEKAIQRAIKYGDPFTQEWEVITAKGNKRWVRSVGKTIREHGKTISVSGSFQDITEYKLTEMALRESEERFQQLFNHMADGVAVYQAVDDGQDFILVDINHKGQALSKLHRNNAIGKRVKDFFPDVEKVGLLNVFRRVWKTSQPEHHPVSKYMDGRIEQWVENYVYKLPSGLIVAIYSDNSKIHQAGTALQQSETLYHSLAEASQDMIFIINRQGTIEYINNFSVRELGKKSSEIVGHDLKTIFPSMTSNRHQRELTKVFETNKPLYAEGLTKFPKRELWLGTWLVPLRDENGKVKSVMGVARDITERKQAEKELLELSSRNEAILASVPDIIMEVNNQKIYTWANKAGREFFGEGVIGKEAAFYFEGDQETYAKVSPLFAGQEDVIYVESWQRRKDGEKRLLAWWCRVLKNADGNVTGALSTARDITESKQAEEILHENEQKLTSIYNTVEDVIFHLSVETEGHYRFISVNPSFCRVTGLSQELIVGKLVNEVIPEPSLSMVLGKYQQAIVSKTTVTWEETSDYPSGRLVGEVSIAPIFDNKGHCTHLVGSVHDITERKLAEEALKSSQQEIAHTYRLLLALNQASQAVQRALTTKAVYSAIQEQISQMGYNATGFELLDDDHSLHITYINYKTALINKAEKMTGLSLRDYHFRPRVGDIYHRTIVEDETVFVDNAALAVADTMPRKLRAMARLITEIFQLKQSIFAPLTVGNETIGILSITGSDLTQADTPAITAFARQAAIALQNARLYEQTRQEITERKLAEEALLKSESSLQAILQSTADGILAISSENTVLYANERFIEMWHIPQTIMTSKNDSTLLEFVLEQLTDPKSFYQKVQELYKSKKDSFDVLYFKDGRVFERTSFPLMQKNDIHGRVWSFHDITARRQAEKLQDATYRIAQAADHNESLEKLYPAIHVIIKEIMAAENFYIALYDEKNDLFSFPYSVDEVDPDIAPKKLGKGLTDYVLRTAKSLLCDDTLFNKLERRGDLEHIGVASPIWLGVPLMVEGKAIGVMAVQDYANALAYGEREQHILEYVSSQVAMAIHRKQVEQALTASEAELRALFAAMRDVVLVIDKDGIYRKIAPTNPTLLFKPPDELLGKKLTDVFSADQAEKFLQNIRQVLKTHQTGQIEYELTVAGEIHWFSVFITPMTNDSTVWVAHDITNRIQAEKHQDAIYRIAQAADHANNLQALYPAIHTIIKEVMVANNFFIALYDEKNDLFNFPYYVDEVDAPPAPQKLSKGLSEYVFQTRQPLLCNEVLFNKLERQGKLSHIGTPSCIWLGVPLMVEDKAIGVMAVQDYKNILAYGEHEQHILEFVSSQVAMAIHRKQAEEDLHSSERMLVEAQQIARIGSWEYDIATDKAIWSNEMYVLFGRDPLLGEPSWLEHQAYIHPADWEALDASVKAAASVGTPYDIECRVQHQERGDTWVWTIGKPIRDNSGKIVSLRGTTQDITERKQAEAALRESERYFHTLFEQAAVGVAMIETKTGRYLDINKRYCNFLGYTKEEMLKLSFQDVSYPEDNLENIQNNELLVAGKISEFSMEKRYVHKDGRILWGYLTASPLWKPGEVPSDYRHIAIVQDITERKQAEVRIQQQLEQLTALGDIDRVIASNFNLELSLSEILTHVTAELNIDAAGILVLNPNSQTLEFSVGRGFRTDIFRLTNLHVDESYAGRAVLERRLIRIPNLKDKSDDLLLAPFLEGEDFVCYFGVPLITKGQVMGVMEVLHRAPLEPDPEWFDFLNALAGRAAIAIENATLFESQQRSNSELALAYNATIEGWSHALDLRDRETEGHTQRVAEMSVKLARAFGLSEAELVQVRWGALLHDIGKMGVPDGILLKPGPLTDEEWVVMKMHPTFAYDMLSPIRYLRQALEIPYGHHEKWDGSGYPHGLKGTQIPLTARIFAVVDVWDALNSDRPYRSAWMEDKVREHILTSSGTHFDPEVVDIFMKSLK